LIQRQGICWSEVKEFFSEKQERIAARGDSSLRVRKSEHSKMIIRFFRSGLLTLGVCLMLMAMKGDAAETPLYTIVEPKLSCEQATQLSAQTIERLGYTLTTSVSTPEQGTTLTAVRPTANKQDELTVTISCDSAGARIEAVPDLSPCEQANQRVTMAMTQLGFTLTSTFPARMGSRGFMRGTREGTHGQETITATTTLLELEFGGKVLREETQGDQFANRRLPQPFAHPSMHLRQRAAILSLKIVFPAALRKTTGDS
jgi:hypothetical protein